MSGSPSRTMSLRFVCIEMRRNLGCANVFLQFDQSLTDTEFLKINVSEQALCLREFSTEILILLSDYFNIEARTVNNLTVEECNASFRLTINNIQEDLSSTTNSIQLTASSELKPQLEEGAQGSVCCRNCDCDLTGTQQFERIREYPSGAIDVNEFFCHHGPNYGELLVPTKADFFYGFQFIVLNKELLADTIKEKETHLYCRRCLEYLGETLCSGKVAKMWADTLQLKQSELVNVFSDVSSCSPNAQLMHKVIRESTVSIEPYLTHLQLCKLLLSATFPNRQQRYLLLHVLERQLQVLRNAQPVTQGNHNNNVIQVKVEPFKAYKLLYRVMDETNTTSKENVPARDKGKSVAPPLVGYWQQDMSVHAYKISPTLFTALLNELVDNSWLLPEMYRNSHDNFQLSYVFYN